MLRRGLDRMRTSPAWVRATTPADRLDALNNVATAAEQTIAENADLVRLMLHEPDAASDLVDELWIRNLNYASHRDGTSDAGHVGRGRYRRSRIPRRSAAVLLAAFELHARHAGPARLESPGDIDPHRFREAWLRLSRAVFTHGVPTD